MMEQRDSNAKMKSKEDIFEMKHFLKDHMHEWFRVKLVKEKEYLQATLGKGLILLYAKFVR